MVKLLVRSFLLIAGIILFIAAIFLILSKAGTMSNGVFMIRDPILLVAGFTIFMIGLVMATFGWKFDQMNQRNYESFLSLKGNGNLYGKGNGKWLIDRILFAMLFWADKNHDEDTARHWIYLIYFLNVLILLPLLVGLLLIVVIIWLEMLQIFGILGVFGLLLFLCLIVYAWKFKQINAFVSSVLSATIGDNKEDYNARVNVKKFIFIIIGILMILSLMSILAGNFVLNTNSGSDAVKSDIILGTWKDIKNDGTYSSIEFKGDGTFSWSEPLVYTRTGYISGQWNNTGDGTHLTYGLRYTDPSTGKECANSITLTRAYYHQYGKLVTCYPYFYIEGISDGGPFSNPDAPQTSVPDVPTLIPSSSPAPGQDVLIGTWKNDHMQEFDWYWMFDGDGTFHSSVGGTLDTTGKWTNIGTHRYRLDYTDGHGIYLDYKDEKIFNEYAPDGTFSRVSYNDLHL